MPRDGIPMLFGRPACGNEHVRVFACQIELHLIREPVSVQRSAYATNLCQFASKRFSSCQLACGV